MSNHPHPDHVTNGRNMNEDTLTPEQQGEFAAKVIEKVNNLLVKPGEEQGSIIPDQEMMPHVIETDTLSDGTAGKSIHVSSDWIPIGPGVDMNGQPDGSTLETALLQVTDNVTVPYDNNGQTINVSTAGEPKLAIHARLVTSDGSEINSQELMLITGEGVWLHEAFDPSSRAGWVMIRRALSALERHKMELLLRARESNLPDSLKRETMLPIINAYSQQFLEAVQTSGSQHRDEVFEYIDNKDPDLLDNYEEWVESVSAEANESGDLSTIIHTNLLVLLPQVSAGFSDEEFVEECLGTFNEMQQLINTLPVDDGLTNLIEQMVGQLRKNTGNIG